MIHPDTQLARISDVIGYGVVATRLIPRGSITWVRDELDQVFSPARKAALPPELLAPVERYGYLDPNGDFIMCWDFGRFVNHSCDPNCMSAGWNFEMAVRDIHPGEQLTDDYASVNLQHSFQCACGSPRCRGLLSTNDFDRLAVEWDAIVGAAVPFIRQVPQPLWPLVLPKEQREVLAAVAGQGLIASCVVNRLRVTI